VDGRECVLIATEETPEDIFVQAEMLGLDLAKYYENGQLIIGRVFESRSNKSRQVTKYGFAQEGLEVELSQLAGMYQIVLMSRSSTILGSSRSVRLPRISGTSSMR